MSEIGGLKRVYSIFETTDHLILLTELLERVLLRLGCADTDEVRCEATKS